MSINDNAKKTSVRELIGEVKKGDQGAFGRLLALYEPMIRSTVNQFAGGVHDAEDLRQEALAVFYRAIMKFDSDKPGIEFGLYAKICVTNALISEVRSARRRAGNTVASLEYEDYNYLRHRAEAESDPAGRVIEEESEKALRSLIKKNLSEYENRVWTMYISGLSSYEISEKLGRSEKSIDNALYRIKRKLRSLLEK
jgi:RNA polymerase sporulation-specific sigma factor